MHRIVFAQSYLDRSTRTVNRGDSGSGTRGGGPFSLPPVSFFAGAALPGVGFSYVIVTVLARARLPGSPRTCR